MTAGGRMLLQLWHVGRISDPMFLNGALPEAPSAIRPKGNVSLVRPEKPFVTPRALETGEIPGIIAAFRRGARECQARRLRRRGDSRRQWLSAGPVPAGFHQSPHRRLWRQREKRARLMLEVADACIEVWGADRVGMHLAPRMDSHDMGDSDPLAPSPMSRANWASAALLSSARARNGKRAISHRPPAASRKRVRRRLYRQ